MSGSDFRIGVLVFRAEASVRRRKSVASGSGSSRFRNPLNRERRFIPLRLDDAPIKGSLAQLLYINWRRRFASGNARSERVFNPYLT